MPFLLQTRTDIPNGLLQTLDLHPNTSIREDAYQPVGQTGYRRVGENEAITITSGAFAAAASGLTAWLAANISSAAGTAATATLTLDTQANLGDGETFTIDDGENSVVFEIKKTAAHIVGAGNVAVDITGATTAADVSAIVEPLVNASAVNVTAVDATGSVNLTNDNQNQPTADQNNAGNASTLGGAGALPAFASATDSDPLTAAEASTNADDILALVGAGALDQATINGALTTGAINKEDVAAVLALLTGAPYTVPAGTSIGTTAFVNAGADIDAPVQGRPIYDGVRLRISFTEGRLSKLVDSGFTYKGVTGAALTVLNDDGTLYTV